MSSPGGISPAIISPRVLNGGGGVSDEVQAVIDLMPNEVSAADQDRIVAIVDPAVITGLWPTGNPAVVATGDVDYFYCFAMADPDNALTSWIGTKIATNINAATHTPLQGYSFNGTTQYLQSDITLSTDMTNWTLDDAHAECYCFNNSEARTDIRAMWGGETAAPDNTRNILFQWPSLNFMTVEINTGTNLFSSVLDTFQDNERYGAGRDDSANQELFINGAEVDTGAAASSAVLSSHEIYIAARNNNGALQDHLEAELSYFLIGGGFNLANLDTMLDTVETQFSL